jgi:hypothetical protein
MGNLSSADRHTRLAAVVSLMLQTEEVEISQTRHNLDRT